MYEINKVIKYLVQKGITPSFNYAILNKDKIYFDSFGYKNLQTLEKVNIDTLYDLASLTKVFTVTVISILKEQNRLNYDDLVSKYIKEFRHKNITIYHLLTHSSGIINKIGYKNLTKDDYLNKLYNIDLSYQTGTKSYYSDLNYILLGIIIEKIANNSLDKVMSDLIFEPLEMNNTSFNPKCDNVAATELTIERNMIRGIVHDEKAYLFGGIAGHAGIFSTIRDLSKFAFMILDDGIYKSKKILSKESIDLWFKEMFFDDITLQKRSFSWIVGNNYMTKKCSKNTISHTGFTGTSILIDKDNNLALIILSNRIHPSRENKRYNIYRKLITDLIFEKILKNFNFQNL